MSNRNLNLDQNAGISKEQTSQEQAEVRAMPPEPPGTPAESQQLFINQVWCPSATHGDTDVTDTAVEDDEGSEKSIFNQLLQPYPPWTIP